MKPFPVVGVMLVFVAALSLHLEEPKRRPNFGGKQELRSTMADDFVYGSPRKTLIRMRSGTIFFVEKVYDNDLDLYRCIGCQIERWSIRSILENVAWTTDIIVPGSHQWPAAFELLAHQAPKS